jgi:co-chaperonin GroES (HSP10)
MEMTDLSKKKAKFLPMPGRVAVEPIEAERYGGLFLPSNRTEKATIGTIVALPPHYGSLPAYEAGDSQSLAVGDVVLFGANSGMAVEVGLGSNRRHAIFLRESEIISRIEWEPIPEPVTFQASEVVG